MSFLEALANLIFPVGDECVLCGMPLRRDRGSGPLIEGMCGECIGSMRGGWTPSCAGGVPHTIPHVSRVIAVGPFEGRLREAILRFKFGGERVLARPLGALMALAVRFEGPYDVIAPVPLHPRRQLERGFNQSHLLAAAVGARICVPVDGGKLRRVQETAAQSELGKCERTKNVEGAFATIHKGAFARKRVLLVDDVLTTGSTVSECSRVLIADGAWSVDVLVAAVAHPGGGDA